MSFAENLVFIVERVGVVNRGRSARCEQGTQVFYTGFSIVRPNPARSRNDHAGVVDSIPVGLSVGINHLIEPRVGKQKDVISWTTRFDRCKDGSGVINRKWTHR